MPLAREQRKLAAIIAADVVGYSRLMGRDESGTLARLRKNRSEHFDPVLTKYGGRLVKLTGDGALVEFASAVDALSAAIEFQQAMAEANRDQPADAALVFRMGLHLGDLIVDGDDLYGDGVNVAARLEGEAPAGGILISRNVRDAVAGRVKATFEDLGGLSLKNIERPVRAFRVQWEPSDWQALATSELSVASATSPQVPLPLPDKPSIAVLPFQNMSGDPGAGVLRRRDSRGNHYGIVTRSLALSSSRATRPSRTRAAPWTSSRSVATWACATSWKVACARPASAYASTAS